MQDNVYKKLAECAYYPRTEIPERTDPDFQEKMSLFQAEEAILVEEFKKDLFAHFGVNPEASKAKQAFEIAYTREGVLGLFAVADLFETLLPLTSETRQ
jgi:hypothetical protein